MPSHAGHKYFRRVTWDQVGNEKIDGNRGPERNKIKTNATEQITHAYPFLETRARATARVHPTQPNHPCPLISPPAISPYTTLPGQLGGDDFLGHLHLHHKISNPAAY